ncbi:MAG: hypothetical protein KJ970_15960 [Candidatus Eisenbacteria bacterium]|uniref:Putative heavy-metal chelation domain-containing protein n=1 Tax=Eiseniibacteriota bacterium TaxID=2212470 RepID=A0A948S222_UNCEI|nr:hypothetical protein [Candidatus Eisenbacteria bacterium]MBU1950853.1 hypothetical protein [Candidatus Eisenbacteria bacterium]MBU2692419.1 hypothetical protein [Candidatus Eisenbacteria bacterium]
MREPPVFKDLKKALGKVVQNRSLAGNRLNIECQALSATEAIGDPDHHDYPILKGKEHIVEAVFEGSRGHAFADEFENMGCFVEDLLELQLDSNSKRACFVSGLNAVFRHLNLCDKTVHCKNNEPQRCALQLVESVRSYRKILLLGYQPRFLEALSAVTDIRVIDRDLDNIGEMKFGVIVEHEEMFGDAARWCDLVLATGSTLVNGTITKLLNFYKPVLFYGVTISAAASILNLNKFCHCGN